jgi:hypothetical protein
MLRPGEEIRTPRIVLMGGRVATTGRLPKAWINQWSP